MFASIIKKQEYYQIPIQHMIAGIQISAIKPTDFYRRFLILEKIMSRGDKFMSESQKSQNRNEYVMVKYSNLIKQLNILERNIQIENNQFAHKQLDSHLNLEQMEKEYQRCFLNADASVTQYQKKIMQTWRDGINKNQEKQKIGRNQSESKANSNKNLMLLTSELLKKERQTKMVIKDEQKKIFEEIEKTRNILMTKKHIFDQNITKMSQAYFTQKQLFQKIANLQNQVKDNSIQKQAQALDSEIKRYKEKLFQQKEQNQKVFCELQSILQDLKARFR